MDSENISNTSKQVSSSPPPYSPASYCGFTSSKAEGNSSLWTGSADIASRHESDQVQFTRERPSFFFSGGTGREADSERDLELGDWNYNSLSPSSARSQGEYTQTSQPDRAHLKTSKSSPSSPLHEAGSTDGQGHLTSTANGVDALRQDEGSGVTSASPSRFKGRDWRSKCGDCMAWTVIGGVTTLVVGTAATVGFMITAAEHHSPPFGDHPTVW